MKTVDVKCRQCQIDFIICFSEYKRQIKNGRDHFFCSRSCACSYGNFLKYGNLHEQWKESCVVCVICGDKIPFYLWKKKHRAKRNRRMICGNVKCRAIINGMNGSMAQKSKLREAALKSKTYLKNFQSSGMNNSRTSSKGERQLREALKIEFGDKEVLAHRHFKIGDDLLKSVDMFLPKYNLIIEYDGEYHFRNIYGNFELIVMKDKLLENWCLTNNYRLIRIDENTYKQDKEKYINVLIEKIRLGNERVLKIGSRY